MNNITVKDIIRATGGELLCGDENTEIKDICINSREAKPGDLFVPIIGEKVDAHRFIENALEVCAATLTSEHNQNMLSDKPYIKVNNTVKALQDIGVYIRNRFDIPIVGITGSVGKTTTREMVATALNANKAVYQTDKNFNSQVGVPITLSRMNENAEIAVLEMGMSEPGQMDILSGIVKPDICVVTMIGVAHIEFLKTKENIRDEKLSIVHHMNPEGVLFLNGDDKMLAEVRDKLSVKTLYYGTSEECEYRAENIRIINYRYAYDYVHDNTRIPVVINALGKHNVINSLIGLAITDYMGLDVKKAAESFAHFEGMRQKLIQVSESYTIIDDTYNASPDSMKAAIEVLHELESQGKKFIVLGDMFELGENEKKFHYEVGEYLADKSIDELIVIGDLAQNIAQALKDKNSSITIRSFKDKEEIAFYLKSDMTSNDIVLLKASNGMKLYDLVEMLK